MNGREWESITRQECELCTCSVSAAQLCVWVSCFHGNPVSADCKERGRGGGFQSTSEDESEKFLLEWCAGSVDFVLLLLLLLLLLLC